MLERWGAFVARRALWVLLTGVALVLAAGAYGSGVFDSLSQGGFDDPDSEASRELALERDTFGNRGVDAVAIYSSDDLTADAPEFRSARRGRRRRDPRGDDLLGRRPSTTPRTPTWSARTATPSRCRSPWKASARTHCLDNWDEVEPTLEAEGLETDVAGAFAVFGDVNESTSEDLARAEKISLPIVVAAGAPDLRQPGRRLDAGARRRPRRGRVARGGADDHRLHRGVDLLRQRDHPARDGPRDRLRPLHDQQVPRGAGAGIRSTTRTPSAKAIVSTMNTAGRTVLFSGLTVAAAMSSLLVFPQAFLKSMGYGGMSAVVVAMLAALTVLPGHAAPARPPDRRRPAALAPAPPGHGRRRPRLVGAARARRDAPSGRVIVVITFGPARAWPRRSSASSGAASTTGCCLPTRPPTSPRTSSPRTSAPSAPAPACCSRRRRGGRRGVPAGGRGGRRGHRRAAGRVRG